MSDSTIEQRVKKLVFERVDNRVEDIQDIKSNHEFSKDLGLDSLDNVELIMSMEEAFNIEISDEDANKIVTVQDAVSYIMKAQADSSKTKS